MNLIPHIDIAEPERIAAILTDPANFVWRALDSETLGDWTPDLGLTYYDNPSIMRVPAAAWSGQPSTLRQRFWGTVEKQCDHTGPRYIGVVLYDAAGQECPLEFRLGADEIGRVEPTRHDNRVHLIVLDQPTLFRGEMEIFQMTAPGRGEYRIEHFVLLHVRPAPSSFAPRIDRLSVNRVSDGSATAHFITSQMASCEIVAESNGEAPVYATLDRMRTVHALTLAGLLPNREYRVTVTVTEKAGETATASTVVPEVSPLLAGHPTTVPLEVYGLGDVWPRGLPLTFGVPLAQGRVFDGLSCELAVSGTSVLAQTRTLSYWADGSARWLLVDAPAPAAPGAGELRFRIGGAKPAFALARKTADGVVAESATLRATVSNALGLLRLEWKEGERWLEIISGLAFVGALADGRELKAGLADEISIEENGAHRSVILVSLPILDPAGVCHLRCRLRLHIYADQPFIRVVQRLEVVSPELPAASGGDEARAMLRLRNLELQLPWTATTPPRRAVQENAEDYRLTNGDHSEVVPGRLNGHFLVPGQHGTLAIGLKEFWQTWPRGFHQGPEGIALELLPELSGDPLPGDEDAWHRIYFWLKDGNYLLKAGLALRSEWLIGYLPAGAPASAAAPAFDWLEQPPVIRTSPDYTNATGVLPPFGTKATSLLPAYEDLMHAAVDAFFADREQMRAYGQLNFGDWYGESGWSWGNNEYDPSYCGYLEFLRGGDPRWTTLGAQAARHLADIDTVNASSETSQIGMQAVHMPAHLGGYLPPLFRSKIGGTFGVPSHTWVEGPLLHYLQTGDEFVRETIEKTRGWLLHDHWFDNCDFMNSRESGWHIIHLCMLATTFNDPRCLNAAAVIVRRVREKEDPAGGWVHNLTEGHCGCGYPRCRGEAGFMVGVLLSGLKRYHDLTGDPEVKRMIIDGARWLIHNTYDAKSGYFRYTSCKKRSGGGGFQQTQWVLEGLANAYDLSGDEEIGSYLRDGLKVIGQFPEGLEHLGLGKAMAMQMRYVPGILAILRSRMLAGSGLIANPQKNQL
jgi:hypothetical protein